MTSRSLPISAVGHSLGADLRALRKARGFTLQGLADRLGRSVGWLSQIERELSTPSVTDLRHLAGALDVAVSSLLRAEAPAPEEVGYVVRAGARRPIGSRAEGLVEELLSPDLTDDFEMVHCVFAPGSGIEAPVRRPTQEVGYILDGQLELWIAGAHHALGPGDSFRVRGEPFRWANPHAAPCSAIWVSAPPVY